MKVLDDDHRKNFLDDVENLEACWNTPAHQMVIHADKYLRDSSLDENSPWASTPGVKGEPYLGCRKNFHALLTDGQWNSEFENANIGNPDGTATHFPDGVSYTPMGPYKDDQGGNQPLPDSDGSTHRTPSTITDWAFHSWATPLKTSGLSGNPAPDAAYLAAPAQETFTNKYTNFSASLEKIPEPEI